MLAGTLSAPLQLPPGAVVTSITAYFYDNSPTADMTLYLIGADPVNNFATIYATVQSTGSANIVNSFSQTLATPLTIDMVNRCYNLEVFCNDWQGGLTRLQGVKLTYTVPAPD